MLKDITGETGAANKFSVTVVIDAAAMLDDQMGGLSAMGVHSGTYKVVLKSDAIKYVPDGHGRIDFRLSRDG